MPLESRRQRHVDRPPILHSTTLPSNEPIVVIVRDDGTITASFPDRRRVYRHIVPTGLDDLYSFAQRPGFTVNDTTPGELTLHTADGDGLMYIWHLDDSEASHWEVS